jgi:hypothetical protein
VTPSATFSLPHIQENGAQLETHPEASISSILFASQANLTNSPTHFALRIMPMQNPKSDDEILDRIRSVAILA